MLSSAITLLALTSGVLAADMGPAAIMWPADRVWDASQDNTPPCGSSAGVGARSEFPLTRGRLALVTQEDTSAVHVSISYDNNPTSMDQFETFFGPNTVGDLGVGHTCISVPDQPANVQVGSNATFSIFYVASPADDPTKTETFYACADVTFVEAAPFYAANEIPCFNATIADPDVSIDGGVNVTTTDSNGKVPHTAEDFVAIQSGGLSGGAKAGIAVGTIVGVALIAVAGFFLWRRKAAGKKMPHPAMAQRWDAEKAASDASSR